MDGGPGLCTVRVSELKGNDGAAKCLTVGVCLLAFCLVCCSCS